MPSSETYIKKGEVRNPLGRPVETPEDKLRKKVEKDFITEYKKNLEEALPLLSPVLIAKALEGDIQAIKEINDRVMGKPNQTNEHKGNITFKFDYDERGTENSKIQS